MAIDQPEEGYCRHCHRLVAAEEEALGRWVLVNHKRHVTAIPGTMAMRFDPCPGSRTPAVSIPVCSCGRTKTWSAGERRWRCYPCRAEQRRKPRLGTEGADNIDRLERFVEGGIVKWRRKDA
jgi:hypothetical protein